jgi:DNA segregation ATPase FtsK/SpoIIIE-like protein
MYKRWLLHYQTVKCTVVLTYILVPTIECAILNNKNISVANASAKWTEEDEAVENTRPKNVRNYLDSMCNKFCMTHFLQDTAILSIAVDDNIYMGPGRHPSFHQSITGNEAKRRLQMCRRPGCCYLTRFSDMHRCYVLTVLQHRDPQDIVNHFKIIIDVTGCRVEGITKNHFTDIGSLLSFYERNHISPTFSNIGSYYTQEDYEMAERMRQQHEREKRQQAEEYLAREKDMLRQQEEFQRTEKLHAKREEEERKEEQEKKRMDNEMKLIAEKRKLGEEEKKLMEERRQLAEEESRKEEKMIEKAEAEMKLMNIKTKLAIENNEREMALIAKKKELEEIQSQNLKLQKEMRQQQQEEARQQEQRQQQQRDQEEAQQQQQRDQEEAQQQQQRDQEEAQQQQQRDQEEAQIREQQQKRRCLIQ